MSAPSQDEAALEAALGPLQRIGRHAGATVWRTARAEVPILKRVPRARGEREVAVLRALAAADPDLRFPRLRLVEPSGPDALLIGLDDVRTGRDPRLRRIDPAQIAAGAAVLARLHRAALPGPGLEPSPVPFGEDLRPEALPEALREAWSELFVIGDALGHGDPHPSNWISEGGRPVGLLDWSSARRMDPERDLAGLVLACGGEPERVAPVAAAWSEAAEREADRARVLLYLWLAVEAQRQRMPDKPGLDALSARIERAARARPPAHGRVRRERAVPIAADPAGEATEDVRLALRRPEVLGTGVRLGPLARCGGHACNDVLRFTADGVPRVIKIYNKPVPPWLFPLERLLDTHLRRVVRVPAPLPLRGGADLLRIGGRPAAIYEDAGTVRPDNGPKDAARLARALVALHTVAYQIRPIGRAGAFAPDPARGGAPLPPGPPLDRPRLLADLVADPALAALRAPTPTTDWPAVVEAVGDRLDAALLAHIGEIWAPLRAALSDIDRAELPTGLLHGSLHRDHCAVAPDGALVLFDLEKARLGPAVVDLVRTATYVGHRGNDEVFAPGRVVGFLRACHRLRPLTAPERELLYPLIVRDLVHDLKALARDDAPGPALLRHARTLLEVDHNRDALRAALRSSLA